MVTTQMSKAALLKRIFLLIIPIILISVFIIMPRGSEEVSSQLFPRRHYETPSLACGANVIPTVYHHGWPFIDQEYYIGVEDNPCSSFDVLYPIKTVLDGIFGFVLGLFITYFFSRPKLFNGANRK